MNRWLTVYIAALFLITLALRIVLIPYYNYNLGGIEPNVIYGIQRILQGQPLYQDPSAGSYAVMQYTPLYYHFIAAVAKIISADAFRHGLDVHALYTVCRVTALIFNLLTVCFSLLIIRALGYGWKRSVVFAMPVLIIVTAHYYTRGDSMQLFFFAAAIWACLVLCKTRVTAGVLLSAIFSAACILTRQSGILATVIIVCVLLFTDRWPLAALAYLLCVAAICCASNALLIHNDWQSFYRNAVLGLKNGIDPSFLYRVFTGRFFLDMVPCYLLCGVVVFRQKNVGDRAFRILVIGAAFSWVFACFTGIKIGSSNNYFTEFLFFIVLVVAYLHNSTTVVASDRAHTLRLRAFATACLLILITSKTLGLFTQVCIDGSFKNDEAEYRKEQNLYHYFTDVLHIAPGEHIFFTERYFLDNLFMPYAIMPAKDVISQVYTADHSTYDYSAFIEGINTGNIKYIVTAEKRNDINVCSDSLPFIQFDKKQFRFVANVSGWCIYCFIPTVLA